MSDRQRCVFAAALLWWCFACGEAAAAVPVLDATPACAYRKLGAVSAEAGVRIKGDSLDKSPAPASYRRAFDGLSDAAQALAANAVVLRGHRATYFTQFGKRSREPVHIDLSGVAIGIEGDLARCKLVVADPSDYRRSDKTLKTVETTAEEAYRTE
ncbi:MULTISPECIES: hypothetical protein [unclassified Lysobacter]|uniref:hypothetical protein n=1 Tax=unclassified Lysobacter TaxID=2635362 RepID=UPI001BE92EAA|nr:MULTISPECIES: hypothetical protein [unclassified Lysobacter]MBT2747654.1 hypothetical protein [Lysobacter sp. ISL-42]MBT2752865.1 hypothetical protein [Lysobacter sp. ISL-50]MBT2779749.1 hypothetical protein [Lysobacter sp. ISL-54]MBT2784559.1 hypothetical protein [Lysobacter sp. ISL-52]